MTDTIELTPVDTVRLTATLRGGDLPPGEYRLHTGRCVVELALCVLGRPAVRGRIEACAGTLTVDELSTLELDLVLAVSGPLARRWSRVLVAAEFVR